MPPENADLPRCFIAMPITTQPEDADRFSDAEHWSHVLVSLFEKAIRQAGFEPVRPVAQGSHLIHGEIIRQLTTADLVLVDLSTHNPNVFFELGVRTSLNLPVALVRDEHTDLPFDTAGINTYTYDSNLHGWEIDEQQAQLAEHLRKSVESCRGQNPLWRQFGLTITAQKPADTGSPLEAKVDLLTMQMVELQESIAIERRMSDRQLVEIGRSRLSQWVDHQLSDPTRNAPSVLFSAAVERVARDAPTMVSVDVTSPTTAVVVTEQATPKVILSRILELADRYDVAVDFLSLDDAQVERKEGATTRGGTFKYSPVARQEAHRASTPDDKAKRSPQLRTAVEQPPKNGRV